MLIGVDGGADALLEIGFKPDIIIGDFDSVSDRALRLRRGARPPRAPRRTGAGRENLLAMGRRRTRSSSSTARARTSPCSSPTRPARSSSSRSAPTRRWWSSSTRAGGGMSSTFLTRLRLGPMLVDAKGVSRLYEGRVRRRDLVLLVVRALLAMVVDRASCREPIHVFLDGIRVTLKDLWYSIIGRPSDEDMPAHDQLPLPHRVARRGVPRAGARRRHGLDGHRPRHRRQPQRPDRHRRSGTRARPRGERRSARASPAASRSTSTSSRRRGGEPADGVAGRARRGPGVDEAPVESPVGLARESGAVVPGILWLEPKLALDDRRRGRGARHHPRRPALDPPRGPVPPLWEALASRLRARGAVGGGDAPRCSALVDAASSSSRPSATPPTTSRCRARPVSAIASCSSTASAVS